MRFARVVRVVGGLLLVPLLAVPSTAFAAPAPTPPPNPSNDELRRSQDAVDGRTAEVTRLAQRLGELQAQAEELQIQVAEQRESANQALDVLTTASAEADLAASRAAQARAATEAAGAAVELARSRIDDVVASTYSFGMDVGPLGLLTSAQGPEDLMDRARLTDALSEQQGLVLDGLERARARQANADSTARQAQQEAEARRQAAARAKADADLALAGAEQSVAAQAGRLAVVASEQADVQRRLDATIAADAGLREQRARFQEWQLRQAEAEAARQRAEQQAAAARAAAAAPAPRGVPLRGTGAARTVIDRAMSQLGVIYAWGGGSTRGPSLGIRDGGYADRMGDYRKVGFDCSGLMLYAFAGAGVTLPRYSGNQHASGDQVPLAQMQPGDMLAWARNGRVYHIALYIGSGRMIEAPYSGATVRITAVRYSGGLLPTASRVL